MGDAFRFGIVLEVFCYTILVCLTLTSILAYNGFRWDRSGPFILGNGASIRQSSRTKCLKIWAWICFIVIPIICTVSMILHVCKARHDYGMSQALYIWWTYGFCIIDSLIIFQAYLYFQRRYWRWIILPIVAILILFCFIAGTLIGADALGWSARRSMGPAHLMCRSVTNILATASIIYVIYQQERHGGRAQLEALSTDELDPLIGAIGDEDIDLDVDIHEKLRMKWPRLVSRILFEAFLCYTVFSFIISIICAAALRWYAVVGYGSDGADALIPLMLQTGGIAINLMFLSTCLNNSRPRPEPQPGPGDDSLPFSAHSTTDVLYSPNHDPDQGILARDIPDQAQAQSALAGAETSADLAGEVQALKEKMNAILSAISERGIEVTLDTPTSRHPAESVEGRAGPALDPDYVDLGHKGKEGPIRL